MANLISVTLDLDLLKEHVRKAVSDNGSLESSSGVTSRELDEAWDAMSFLFTGVNEGFGKAVSEAISIIREEEEDPDRNA